MLDAGIDPLAPLVIECTYQAEGNGLFRKKRGQNASRNNINSNYRVHRKPHLRSLQGRDDHADSGRGGGDKAEEAERSNWRGLLSQPDSQEHKADPLPNPVPEGSGHSEADGGS